MTNDVKGTLTRTSSPLEKKGIQQAPDYIAQVNEILDAHDGNTINPNSTLYQQALAQYNDALKKGSLRRLAVPGGFCGFVDPVTGEVRIIPDLQQTPIPPGSIPTESSTFSNAVTAVVPIPYRTDECLKLGTPGSEQYSKCIVNTEDELPAFSGIDWGEAVTGTPHGQKPVQWVLGNDEHNPEWRCIKWDEKEEKWIRAENDYCRKLLGPHP